MQRSEPIEPADASPEVGQIYDGAKRLTGIVSNLTQTLAHSPERMRSVVPFLVTVQREGTGGVAKTKIKEPVILKTSTINACEG